MSTQVIWARDPNTGSGATNRCVLNGFIEATGVADILPIGGSFTNLQITLETAPGAGTSRTVTLRKNGVDTACAVTISGTNTTGQYTGTPITYAIEELLDIRYTVSGSPAASVLHAAIEFTPDTEGAMIFGFNGNSQLDPNEAMPILGGGEQGFNNDFQHHSIVPVDGTVTALACRNSVTPTAGNSLIYSLLLEEVNQNGSGGTVDTRLTIDDTEQQDYVTFSLPVTQGQSLAIQFAYGAGTVGGNKTGYIVFVPATPVMAITAMTGQTAGNNEYALPITQHSIWVAGTPQQFYGAVSDVSFKTIIAEIGEALIGAQTWTFTLIKNGSPTALTVTITSASPIGLFSLSSGIDIGPTDQFGLLANNSGTPSANSARQRIALITEPTVSPSVQTLPATSVRSTSATLRGRIDPNGIPITGSFKYGQTRPTKRRIVLEGCAFRWDSAPLPSHADALPAARGAFVDLIREQGVTLSCNFDPALRLASQTDGSLEAWEDNEGLKFRAVLKPTPLALLVAFAIDAGLINGICIDGHHAEGRYVDGAPVAITRIDMCDLNVLLVPLGGPSFPGTTLRVVDNAGAWRAPTAAG